MNRPYKKYHVIVGTHPIFLRFLQSKFLKLIPGILILLLLSKEAEGDLMDFVFSNKKYKENIKVEAYLISEDEVYSLFKDTGMEKISQKSYKELYRKIVYLVVRLKNEGNRGAWGLLDCKVYERNFKISIPVMTPNMDKWNYYVVSLSGLGWPRDNSIPKITTEWKELYSK